MPKGRQIEFNDQFHEVMRKRQLIYDREISRIRKEHNCGYEEARRIRLEQKRKAKK